MANYTGYQGAGNSSEHAAVYPTGGNTSPGARVRRLLPPGHPFHQLPENHPIWRILGRRLGGGVKQFPRGELSPPGFMAPPAFQGGPVGGGQPPAFEGGPTPAGWRDNVLGGVPPGFEGGPVGTGDPNRVKPDTGDIPAQRVPVGNPFGQPGALPAHNPALSLTPGYTPDGSEFGRGAAPGGGVGDIRERLLRRFRGTAEPQYGIDGLRNYVQQHMARRAQAMPGGRRPILPQRTARKLPY